MVDTQNNVMETSTNSGSSEVVYGTTGSVGSGDDSRVMSDKVQLLASSIYKEFETMIQKSGEDSVKNLMPLVVNVLESLDLAYLEKEEYSVDLEMLKEDNEQLITQYEREKQLRRAQDQKCLEIEDTLMEQIRELESKIESLESIMRMLELKAKNASDHAARLEEREADQKNEFDKLHERYNVLLRTHIDHMERTKYLMGSDKFEMMQNMPLPSQQLRTKIGMATSLDAGTIRGVSDLISAHMSQSTTIDVNLANHISNEADWQEEFGQSGAEILQSPRDDSSSVIESPRVEQQPESLVEEAPPNADVNPPEAEDSLGADLTGALVDPAEFASAGNHSSWHSLSFNCRACARIVASSHEMPFYSNPVYNIHNNNNSCCLDEGSVFSTKRCPYYYKCLACELHFARHRCRRRHLSAFHRDRNPTVSSINENQRQTFKWRVGSMGSDVDFVLVPKSLWLRLCVLRKIYRRLAWRRQRRFMCWRRRRAKRLKRLVLRCLREEEWRWLVAFISMLLSGCFLVWLCHMLRLVV
uniref:JNK-interacting protein n=1 Tax=Ascaris suum TaxID=6253 RepID=F1L390_ASCSU